MIRRLDRGIFRRADVAGEWLYYRFLYGRTLPAPLAGAARHWERIGRGSDLPQSVQSWEDQYRCGHWDFLGTAGERARFSVIVGLLSATERPSVLDVGCGDGTLYRRFRTHGYSRYVGIDLSPRAVALAEADAARDTHFFVADATAYRPEGSFDAIVFNEVLYYLHQPAAEVARYAESLAAGGRIIVSTYVGSPRAAAVLRQVCRAFEVREETQVSQGGNRWMVTVLAP